MEGIRNDRYFYNQKEYTMPPNGFSQFFEFKKEKSEDNSIPLLLTSNQNTFKLYPFSFEFRVSFDVCENSLNIAYKVTNTGNSPMYFFSWRNEWYSIPEGIEEYDIIFNERETLSSYVYENDEIRDKTFNIIEHSNRLSLKEQYFEHDSLIFRNILFDSCTLIHRNGTRCIKLILARCQQLG